MFFKPADKETKTNADIVKELRNLQRVALNLSLHLKTTQKTNAQAPTALNSATPKVR